MCQHKGESNDRVRHNAEGPVQLTSVRFKTLENQGFPVAVYISVLSIRLQLPSNIAFLKYRSREHVYSGRSNAALLPIPGEPG
jgi:hypothetical protein